MGNYHRILLAVDLTEECRRVARRATALADAYGSELHIVHVIEPLSLAYGGDVPLDLSTVQDQIHEQAKSHLAEFAGSIGIPDYRRHLVFGRPESEIHRIAVVEKADVIVVGSHGRHGLALLLGSTANGVLHGATCDVLAVRVGPDAPPE
ncbi:MAG: universal stress protein [Gammaproteobacteria bacterium]|nr:universal stress protein [Gammaproteobacteria bacterium]MYE24604.1 universal stress protein [Gammaproteobacteria bacterium]